MLVTAQAVLDASERPTDWATEIWSGRHTNRPGSGGNLLAAEALGPAASIARCQVGLSAWAPHPWISAVGGKNTGDRSLPRAQVTMRGAGSIRVQGGSRVIASPFAKVVSARNPSFSAARRGSPIEIRMSPDRAGR
jgi:hypothetical protein